MKIGSKHTSETIEKLRKANLGKNNPRYGKSPSKQTRDKLSKANSGYKHGEEALEKMRTANKGKNNPAWKGGITKLHGYILIHSPYHPYKNNYGYILHHRLIIETQIGRYLKPKEACHHLNKIRDDNRTENLMAFKNNGIHLSFEAGNPINISDIIFDGRNL